MGAQQRFPPVPLTSDSTTVRPLFLSHQCPLYIFNNNCLKISTLMYGSLNSSHCLSSTVLQILAIRGFGLIIPFGEIAQNSLNPGLAQP